jgi:predicted transport protein
MLNNKADFILEYNEKTNGNLKRDNVDWSQSRVLFLAQSFTAYQQNAINFRDLPIELWEVKVFDNSTILYNQLLSQEAKESIKTITKNKTIESVSREVKVYTIEDHLAAAPEKIKKLFVPLRDKILALGEGISERPQKLYVAFRTQKNFAEIEIQKEKLKIHIDISKSKLNDPKNISRNVENIGHYGTGVTEIVLENLEDLPYIMTLLEQSYKTSRK